MFKTDEKLQNEQFKPMVIKHNITGTDKDRWIKQFRFNEELRKTKRKDANRMYHEVISFSIHDKQHINSKLLKDIGKKYIQERGIQNMYLITHHIEKEHIHLHAAVSGTQFLTGKANRMSKEAFRTMQQKMELYQREKYPQLLHSVAYTKVAIEKRQETVKEHRKSHKADLQIVLQEIYKDSKTKEDFTTKIEALGHSVYYRAGELTGISYKGDMKFRLSKLGYSKEQLKDLDSRSRENDEKETQAKLEELDQIRSGGNSRGRESEERTREVDTDERDYAEDEERDTDNDPDDDK